MRKDKTPVLLPAISSYSLGLLRMACEAAKRADAATAAKPNKRTDESLTSIILAACAAEAFINDLAGVGVFVSRSTGATHDGNGPRLVAACEAIESLEENNCDVRSKYLMAAILLDCKVINRGKEPFQSFGDLVVLRNAVAHAGPVTIEDKGGHVRVADTLTQRKLALPATGVAETWWTRIQTPAVAWWAPEAATAIMLALVTSAAAIADPDKVFSKYYITYLADASIAIKERRVPPN
jgi:hypothetical protein